MKNCLEAVFLLAKGFLWKQFQQAMISLWEKSAEEQKSY